MTETLGLNLGLVREVLIFPFYLKQRNVLYIDDTFYSSVLTLSKYNNVSGLVE